MPRVTWSLQRNRPIVQIQVFDAASGAMVTRTLLADTGAGGLDAPFELILRRSDCERYRGLRSSADAQLRGAIIGTYTIYAFRVELPALSFARWARVVAVPDAACPTDLDGIAGFRFLSSFTDGNFGDRNQFGLETA